MKKLMIVAGEASGDLYGGGLVKALKKRVPELKVFGMGGERMRASGVEILADIRDVSALGIVEVISYLGRIKNALSLFQKKLTEERPDALVLIDFPEFNLRLAEKAKSEKIPIIYFVGPQIWAWRSKRVKKISALVDKMLVAFPFEVDVYRKAGLDSEFVGHPLLDEYQIPPTPPLLKGGMGGLKEEGIKRYNNLDPKRPVLALLPGSRRKEVEVLLPIMLKTLNLLKEKGVQAIIPVAPTIDFYKVEEMVRGEDVILRKGEVQEILSISDAAIIASGTATLQAAIEGVPMVIIYKVSPITYILGKILVKIKNIGIVNIVAGREIVPELIQSDARPEEISGVIKKILDDPVYRDRMKRDLLNAREKLGSPGASEKAAEEILKFIGRLKNRD